MESLFFSLMKRIKNQGCGIVLEVKAVAQQQVVFFRS